MQQPYRNARYDPDGRITCEVKHPTFGWIPFTADPNDSEPRGREIFARIVSEGGAADYSPPPPKSDEEILAEWRARTSVTPLQGKLALGETQWVRVEEILADPETPWTMKETIRAASVWKRNSEDIQALAWLLGFTETEVDALFEKALTINI
jgi:hypothetical protein